MLKLYGAITHEPQRVDSYKLCLAQLQYKIKRICVFFFRWKIKIYFNEWTPSVIFSQVVQPWVKILPMVFTRWNKFQSFTKKKKIFCVFHAFNPLWEKLYQNPVQFFSVIPHGIPLPHSNALQNYVKRKKCKVNDIVFPSGCEAHTINLGNKTWKSVFSLVVPV